MRRLFPLLAAALLTVAVVAAGGFPGILLLAQSAVSSGGAFLPNDNYVLGGVWTWKGASPLTFEGATNDSVKTTLTVTDPTAARTWTLPDATDTFVGRATTDTLTNKTLTAPVITALQLGTGGTTTGSAGSSQEVSKTVTAIADATFADLLTVTVPNAAHGATVAVVLHGILGAGGTVGAGECSATAYGQVVLARTAGLATVATAVALSNTGSACVAGATTIVLAYQVTAMTGANGATQTFTIQGKVTKGAGSSANHVILVEASVLNWNGSGVTIQ